MNARVDTFGRIASVLVIVVVLLLEFQLKVKSHVPHMCALVTCNHWSRDTLATLIIKIYNKTFSFSDIDECVSESSPCSLHKDCFNTVGSYMCNCKSGFIPSGPYCIGKNL